MIFVLDSRELNTFRKCSFWCIAWALRLRWRGPDVNLKVEIRAEAAYISHEEIKGSRWTTCRDCRQRSAHAFRWDWFASGRLSCTQRGVEYWSCPTLQAPSCQSDCTEKGSTQLVTRNLVVISSSSKYHLRGNQRLKAYLTCLTHRFADAYYWPHSRTSECLWLYQWWECLVRLPVRLWSGRLMLLCTPLIRPVVTMDKLEINDLAQKLIPFGISIQPFEDCCTIFAPWPSRLIKNQKRWTIWTSYGCWSLGWTCGCGNHGD